MVLCSVNRSDKKEWLKKVDVLKGHKHLPGIPSESEMKEKGYDVHEMNVKLLEKVEELYLLMIELKKENEEIRKRK